MIDRLKQNKKLWFLTGLLSLVASLITSYLIIKENSLGYISAPILFFKAFTLLFSVGLGGFLKTFYNQTVNFGDNMFYFGLSFIFLLLALLSFKFLEFDKQISK